jgi:hypothetical protein
MLTAEKEKLRLLGTLPLDPQVVSNGGVGDMGLLDRQEILTPPVREPGVLPRWLRDQGADAVIAGKGAEKAQELLRENGIEVIIGAPMDAPKSLVNQYLAKTLVSDANIGDH